MPTLTVKLPDITHENAEDAANDLQRLHEKYDMSQEDIDTFWQCHAALATRILIRNKCFPGDSPFQHNGTKGD